MGGTLDISLRIWFAFYFYLCRGYVDSAVRSVPFEGKLVIVWDGNCVIFAGGLLPRNTPQSLMDLWDFQRLNQNGVVEVGGKGRCNSSDIFHDTCPSCFCFF